MEVEGEEEEVLRVSGVVLASREADSWIESGVAGVSGDAGVVDMMKGIRY